MESTLTCPCCKQMFDLDVKEPGQLTCCGETVCRECFNGKFKQGNVVKCILCDESAEKCQLVISRLARKLVKEALVRCSPCIPTCDIHEENRANVYITSVNKMVCMECLLSEYKDNVQESVFIDSNRLGTYVKAAIKKMKGHISKVTAVIDTCQGLYQNEQITSQNFMTLANEIQTVVDITDVEEEKKENEPSPYLLSFLTHDPQENQVQKRAKHIPQQGFKYSMSEPSSIKEVNDNSDLIRFWIGNKNMKLKLEFRATRHGFGIDSVRKLLLGKGPLIVFIKNEFNQVFGAFCSVPWTDKGGDQRDPTAFLFQLTHQTKHVQFQQYHLAVRHSKDHMFHFGACDIAITPDCDTDDESFAHLGHTYKQVGALRNGSGKGDKYLAGGLHFTVTEIEVFTVTFD